MRRGPFNASTYKQLELLDYRLADMTKFAGCISALVLLHIPFPQLVRRNMRMLKQAMLNRSHGMGLEHFQIMRWTWKGVALYTVHTLSRSTRRE